MFHIEALQRLQSEIEEAKAICALESDKSFWKRPENCKCPKCSAWDKFKNG